MLCFFSDIYILVNRYDIIPESVEECRDVKKWSQPDFGKKNIITDSFTG
jgi:hypothetical protein